MDPLHRRYPAGLPILGAEVVYYLLLALPLSDLFPYLFFPVKPATHIAVLQYKRALTWTGKLPCNLVDVKRKCRGKIKGQQ